MSPPTSGGQRRWQGWARGTSFHACLCMLHAQCRKSAQLLGSGLALCLAHRPQTGGIPEGRGAGGQWVGGRCSKKQTRFLGSVSQGAIPIPFQAVSFSHSPQPMTAALGPPAPPALGLRYTARQGTDRSQERLPGFQSPGTKRGGKRHPRGLAPSPVIPAH